MLEINSVEDLENILKEYNLDTSLYGKGNAKTLDHLFKEIKSHECILVKSNNSLEKIGSVSNAYITYKDKNNNKYILKEDHQTFISGRERDRKNYTDFSIAEKIKPNEKPIEAIRRGLKEELGVINGYIIDKEVTNKTVKHSSYSYPGLYSEWNIYSFKIYFSDDIYKEEGYIEKQSDKTNYYIWEKV